MILFDSVDVIKRTATFNVNGVLVTRGIVEGTPSEKLEEHIRLMVQGLAKEFAPKPPLTVEFLTIKKGEDLTPPVQPTI